MEHDAELSDLRLQFQALQQQQEQRKLNRKKEKGANRLQLSVAQDDLDLSRQGVQADNPKDRWVLQQLKQMCTKKRWLEFIVILT